jgi:hypothetical protein
MVGAQLSLFNISQTVATSYRVGDRVKLRKKPMAASYVKKGDLVEITAIHPLDGSIKFWNERSESWEFIHPDEIGSVVKSAADSVTPAEVAVTESNCQHSGTDIMSPVEVVTESKLAPGNNDSVTPAEVAVTESKLAPGNDDFLALNAVSTYKPRGTARSGKYYRLSYREGGRVRHQHIRGGNTDSPIAQAKVQEVRSLLASGVSPAEIARWLRDSPSSV